MKIFLTDYMQYIPYFEDNFYPERFSPIQDYDDELFNIFMAGVVLTHFDKSSPSVCSKRSRDEDFSDLEEDYLSPKKECNYFEDLY